MSTLVIPQQLVGPRDCQDKHSWPQSPKHALLSTANNCSPYSRSSWLIHSYSSTYERFTIYETTGEIVRSQPERKSTHKRSFLILVRSAVDDVKERSNGGAIYQRLPEVGTNQKLPRLAMHVAEKKYVNRVTVNQASYRRGKLG